MVRREFSIEEILTGLENLGEVESGPPCSHRYRNLFPQIVEELITLKDNENREEIIAKYGYVFEEIATCHPCVEEYLTVAQDTRTGKSS